MVKGRKIITASAFFILILIFSACTESPKPKVKYKPNLTNISANIEILRFDEDFSTLDTANISQALDKLKEKHGDFVKTFLYELLNDGKKSPMEEIAKGWLSIPEFKEVGDSIKKKYPDLKNVKKEIEAILQYKTYYFGEQIFPVKKIYTYNTLFKYGAFVLDDFGGIGLDFFLGENFPGYMSVEALRPYYKRRALNEKHIAGTFASAIAESIVSQSNKTTGNKMIDLMILEGKKFFVKASLMPETADSIIYNFSNYQVQFCERGEVALWKHLGEENILYSSKTSDFLKYISEGPFKPDLNLPGNSGSWLGAQIIMQNANRIRRELKNANPGKSAMEIDRQLMKMILEETDNMKFIQKYKPSK